MFTANCIVKDENKVKRGREWPILKKVSLSTLRILRKNEFFPLEDKKSLRENFSGKSPTTKSKSQLKETWLTRPRDWWHLSLFLNDFTLSISIYLLYSISLNIFRSSISIFLSLSLTHPHTTHTHTVRKLISRNYSFLLSPHIN